MASRKGSGLGILALIIAISALGLGGYTYIRYLGISDQTSTPEGISVYLINPDIEEIVSGQVSIKAIVMGSENYSISVLRNGTSIGTSLPLVWDTEVVSDGWWNITIIIEDNFTSKAAKDTVIVYVFNEIPTSRAFRSVDVGISGGSWIKVNFDVIDYDVGNNFNITTNAFTCPYSGFYLVSGMVTFFSFLDGEAMYVAILRNSTTFEAGTTAQAAHMEYLSAGVVDIIYLNETDTIELWVYHTGGLRFITGSSNGAYTYLTITFIDNLEL